MSLAFIGNQSLTLSKGLFASSIKASSFLSCVKTARYTSHVCKTRSKLQSIPLVAKDTFWSGKVPPSTVLGIGEKVPSPVYLLSSVICLILGSYCVYESNLFSPLTVNTINPWYVLGSLLVPYSWGLHVAGWIQLKNGK
eukprot:jgi/Galph1/2820/GphlegSOOS_G1481.1